MTQIAGGVIFRLKFEFRGQLLVNTIQKLNFDPFLAKITLKGKPRREVTLLCAGIANRVLIINLVKPGEATDSGAESAHWAVLLGQDVELPHSKVINLLFFVIIICVYIK